MTVADLAIIAGLVFAWGTLSARLERFDMTAPIVFTAAGVLLAHGPLAPLRITSSSEFQDVLFAHSRRVRHDVMSPMTLTLGTSSPCRNSRISALTSRYFS